MATSEMTPEQAKILLAKMDNAKSNSSEMTPEIAQKLLGKPEKKTTAQNLGDYLLDTLSKGIALKANAKQGLGKAASEFSKAASFDDSKIPDVLNPYKGRKIPDNFAPEMSPIEKVASTIHPNYATTGYVGGYIYPSFTPIGLEAQLAARASQLSKAAQIGAKVLGRSGEGAIVGGAYNPEDKAHGAGVGALLGGASVPAEAAAPYAFNAARALAQTAHKYGAMGLKKLLGAHATADEAQRTMQASKNLGTSSSLGEVIGSPGMRNLESLSAYVPFTGNAGAYEARGKKVKASVEDTLHSMNRGDPNGELSDSLVNDLTNAQKAIKSESENKYALVDQLASESNEHVNLSPVHKEFDDIEREINNKASLNKYKDDEDIKELKESLYSMNIDPSTGIKNPEKITFIKAIEAKKSINEKIADISDKLGSSSDPQKRRFLMRLKSALDESIEQSAKNSSNPHVYDALKEADKHYAQVVSPFDYSFGKYIRGFKDADLLAPEFVKNSRYPRNNLLKQLTDNLTPESKQAIGYENLNRGTQEFLGEPLINEDKALNEYLKMSPKAREAFYTKEQRMKLDSAALIRKSTGLDLKQMVQTKTGEKTAKLLAAGLVGGIGGSYATGHEDIGTTGLAAYLAALIFGKASRNQGLQNALIKTLRASERRIPNPLLEPRMEVNFSRASRVANPLIKTRDLHNDNQGKKKNDQRGGK